MKRLKNACMAVLCCTAVVACKIKQDPYLNHKLVKQEKLNEGCSNNAGKFSMVSNIVGERYEFQKCLSTAYNGQYTAERKGDTVVVNFTKATGPEALFNLTLDIDAYPRYNYLTIDDATFTIIPATN